MPIESVRGPYGGYRVGRGLRLPPLMFTATEALGLVMAVLEAHGGGRHGDDPVASAVGKMVRVLPENVARPLEALRHVTARRTDPDRPTPRPPPPWCGPVPTSAGSASATRSARTASAACRSILGPSWSGTAGGTSSAGRTRPTPAGCTASTGSPLSRCWPTRSPRRGPRAAARSRGADVPGLAARSGGRDRGAVRRRAPLGAAQLRPPRAARRRPHPLDRQHREPGLVRHRDRRVPCAVPRDRWPGAPRRRARRREAAARVAGPAVLFGSVERVGLRLGARGVAEPAATRSANIARVSSSVRTVGRSTRCERPRCRRTAVASSRPGRGQWTGVGPGARDVKHLPGRPKTDALDAVWLCKLAERQMLRPASCRRPRSGSLRDLTRYRMSLVAVRVRRRTGSNRPRTLASSLSVVASDIFGVSGRLMMKAMIDGERDPARLAEMAKSRMRAKIRICVRRSPGSSPNTTPCCCSRC